MSESSTTRAGRVSASAKKEKNSSLLNSNATRTNSNKRGSKRGGGDGHAGDSHLSPTDAGDSDDEYDRSKVVFTTNSSPFECGDISDNGNLNGASGTRVKLLWKDIKGEDDGENPAARRSKSINSKSARAQKPKSPPVPRAIQKRADAKPTSPHLSLASAPAVVRSGITGSSHQDLLERIVKWEEELKSSFSDALAPPVHSIKNGVGSDSLPMAFRKACAESIKRYPQSANKMSIDKRLWVSWYKEIDALQGLLRSGSTTNNAVARSPSPGKISKPDEATTRKLQALLASCTEFYSRLVVELRMAYQHQRHQSNNNTQEQQQQQQHAIQFSLHMCLVALGDTARYAQKVLPNHHDHDWSIAQQHYERALEFLPSNGKVYNQLALLAMTQRQALKSVYLYARSLACETPFSSRENLVHALKKGKAKRVDEQTRCSLIAEVQERVGALLLSCVDGLFSGPPLVMETGDGDDSWDANTSSLLGGLRYYLETCTLMLLAGNRLALEEIRSGLNQIVCVLIFFVHYFQMPSTSARHLSHSDFDQEIAGWRANSRVQRLLSLGFAVTTCLMKECAKAVLTSEYLVVAKDLMNTLLPPISIFLDWLRLHPWFLESQGGSSVSTAADFLSCTVNLLFSISASLLADRILDEDMSAMSEKLLPEDRELLGFLPINKSDKPTAASDTDEDNDDDEMLLDVRLCRVLGFSDDFLRLNGKVPTSQVSWKLQERSASCGSVSFGLIVYEPSLEPTSTIPEPCCNGFTDSSGVDEIALLSDLLLKSSAIASKPLSSSLSSGGSAAKSKASKQHGARRGSHPQRRTSPRESITSASSSSSPPEDSRGFAAVMAIGADKKLYDASANPQSSVQKCLIVIDAPNVAMRHGFHKKFSCKGIRLAFDYFLQRGHRVVGFLPDYLIRSDEVEERRRMVSEGVDVPAAKIPDDVTLLQEMVEEGLLIPTPAQDYDDSYCIQYAGMYDGCVVTNDLYRDHVENMMGPRERKVAMRSWLIAHRISYTWVGNEFLPNPNFR